MKLRGNVEEIIYYNEENGYTVINFNANGQLIVVVGIFPLMNEGEYIEITGDYKFNQKFGEQFVATDVDFLKINDKESIIKYLASGLFAGIGIKTAISIVEKFGEKTLDIIKDNPEKLTSVNKIGQKKAKEISRCYIKKNKLKDKILFLQKKGITTSLEIKIYKVYEDNSIKLIKENPYRLVQDIDGVGFLTADKLASGLGINKESNFRIKAGIVHTLKTFSQKKGHTYLPLDILINETSSLIKITDLGKIGGVINEFDEDIKITTKDDKKVVSLSQNYYTENWIAEKLIKLKNSKEELNINIDKKIAIYEKCENIILHKTQKEAIINAINDGVVIITGGPGTGKTTIIKCINFILTQRCLKVALCAPTGRASKRMSEATGVEAKTIHRLLGINGKQFDINNIDPLECDAIIIDEISMADIYIFNLLLKAIPQGARLILVGDKDQLPSVACGNILSDIINSKLFSTIYLTEIYRQEKESMIILNAHRINNSQMPIIKDAKDFFIDKQKNPNEIKDEVISMASTRIPNFLNLSIKDIQVLSPMKKGIAGVENLNKELQKTINPKGKEKFFRNTIFRVNDKVMQIQNNYTIEWTKYDGVREKGSGVFNGDIGYILDIKEGKVFVEFEDGKLVEYNEGNLDQLILAYCVSVHKSQGCEFPVVILVITSGSYEILTKNLLYTAVTRAKRMVVIVGDDENLYKMVNNNYTAKRYSLLKDMLEENNKKYKKLWGINEN